MGCLPLRLSRAGVSNEPGRRPYHLPEYRSSGTQLNLGGWPDFPAAGAAALSGTLHRLPPGSRHRANAVTAPPPSVLEQLTAAKRREETQKLKVFTLPVASGLP